MIKYIKEILVHSGFELSSENKKSMYRYSSETLDMCIVVDEEETEYSNVQLIIKYEEENISIDTTVLNKNFNMKFINDLLSLYEIDFYFEEPDNLYLSPEYLIENGFKWFEYLDNSTNTHYGECSLVTDDYSIVVKFNFYISYIISTDDFVLDMSMLEKVKICDFIEELKGCNIDLKLS